MLEHLQWLSWKSNAKHPQVFQKAALTFPCGFLSFHSEAPVVSCPLQYCFTRSMSRCFSDEGGTGTPCAAKYLKIISR